MTPTDPINEQIAHAAFKWVQRWMQTACDYEVPEERYKEWLQHMREEVSKPWEATDEKRV